jgi:carboxypeptidase Q
MTSRSLAAAALLAVAIATPTAQERVDDKVVAQIKTEAFQRSQVMETLSWLTDVHGPRLTNSPGYLAAAEWARARMESWGLVNAQLESWGAFGPGWSVDRYSVEMTEPT